MAKSNLKSVSGLTIAVSLLCIISIVGVWVASYSMLYGSGEGRIVFHEDFYPMQITIFIGYLLFKTSFYLLLILFVVKQCRAIKNGSIFLRANIKIAYLMSACYFIGNFCDNNMETFVIPNGTRPEIQIVSDSIIFAILLFIFSILYKVAVDVSEENNLTI